MAKLSREKRKFVREKAIRRQEFEARHAKKLELRMAMKPKAIESISEAIQESSTEVSLFVRAAEIDRERLLDTCLFRLTYYHRARSELIQHLRFCVTFQEALDHLRRWFPYAAHRMWWTMGITEADNGMIRALLEEAWRLFRIRIRRSAALERIIEGRVPALGENQAA